MANLFQIASGIFFYEFDGDTSDTNISAISGWMEANLGELNNLIYTQFSGADADLNVEQSNIYKHLYLGHFYKKKSRNAIKNIVNGSASNVLSVRDEDSAVSFVNSNEISKQFRQLSKDNFEELNKLVASYNSYQAAPLQVGAKNMLMDVLTLTGTGFYYGYIKG
jgi:hypothetical protein